MLKRLHFHFFKFFRPLMVGRFRKYDGSRLPLTRVSNTTYIGNPETLDIENNVFIGHFNFIDASNGVRIEEGCQITNYVSILSHSSHQSIRLYGKEYTSTYNHIGYIKGKVKIGAYTFIGPHTVIMPSTVIGKGSLVAAFSFVKGEFPEFAIIAGNPAIVIGDTRKMDEPMLEQHPELKPFYNEWVNRIK